MAEAKESATWDEGTKDNNYVNLEADTEKVMSITNWKLEKVHKFGKDDVEFIADVVNEDGEAVEDKLFTSVSKRLKIKLREVLENKDPKETVKLSILMVGEKYNTQYSVKEIAEEPKA